MNVQDLQDIQEKRRAIRPLLSTSDAGDALASYYGLWHDPRRTQLFVHRDSQNKVDGFAAVAQTGADLFRPLVTFRAERDMVAHDLLHQALVPKRPYRVIVPIAFASAARDNLRISRTKLNCVYMLEPSQFQSIINVLVQRTTAADGAPRFQIESQGEVVAMSGTNWRSPSFAEVFVYVHPKGRGRGWGKSVVAACTAALLEERLRPVYMVEENNTASIALAEGLGFRDTGHREFSAEAQLP